MRRSKPAEIARLPARLPLSGWFFNVGSFGLLLKVVIAMSTAFCFLCSSFEYCLRKVRLKIIFIKNVF